MTYYFGLEKEFFVFNDNNEMTLVPTVLPHDDCGLLAEARGDPFPDIVDAVFSLSASEFKLQQLAGQFNVHLYLSPLEKVSKSLRLRAMRNFDKGMIHYQNIYGYESHRNPNGTQTAGVHLSITNRHYNYVDGKDVPYNAMFDYVSLFKLLDKMFKEEIKEAKRLPGFYEIKPDGRIEYRSLPSNIGITRIIYAVQKWLKE